MPGRHAVLSASSSKQWLHCPPSARLQANFPNESSVYAEEGTWAHELCEYKVKKYLHERKKRPQSEFFTEEIEQATDVYAEFVISIIEGMKRNGVEPLCFVEERLDFSNIVPEGFGTGDMIILGKDEQGRGLLHICDYKNGKGVFVDSHENSQMMLYATGALNAYGYIYEIETVRMSIIQPRLENISTYEISAADLRAWGESIKPIAQMAFEGKGEQHPGDWCRFCRAKPVCKAVQRRHIRSCIQITGACELLRAGQGPADFKPHLFLDRVGVRFCIRGGHQPRCAGGGLQGCGGAQQADLHRHKSGHQSRRVRGLHGHL